MTSRDKKDSKLSWWDEFKRGIGKLTEIRAGLDSLLEEEEIDWDQEFVRVDVYDVAYDAADAESWRYRKSKSFAASYMLIDGLRSDTFREMYSRTHRMSRVSSIIRLITSKMHYRGVKLQEEEFKYVMEDRFSSRSKRLRVYRPLHGFVYELAADMEIDMTYLISLLIIGGSKYEEYVELYNDAMGALYRTQVIRFERALATARAMAEVLGTDADREMARRVLGLKKTGKKRRWEVRDIDEGAIEIVRRIAKERKMKIGEVVEDAIYSQCGWYYASED